MITNQIREELHQFIDRGDSRLLKILYTIAKEYIQEDYTSLGVPMTEETLKERVRAAKNRIKAGQYTSQEELENEIKKW